MDLNELYSRHQIALIAMLNEASVPSRSRAEECANYYADRIATAREGNGVDSVPTNHSDLKRIIRG